MQKPIVLVVYDYFYPGYKAGGPVQSLTNLVATLQDQFDFRVLTSAHDLHEALPYPNIETDKWQHVPMPGVQSSIPIWYCSGAHPTKKTWKRILTEVNPNVVYLNGIFSFKFFVQPLLVIRGLKSKPQVVICPRGMFQKGALAIKPLKKKIYLGILKFVALMKNIVWHATNKEEAIDIKNHFPLAKEIIVAANIPKQPYPHISFSEKKSRMLRLVYLSLITQKKNLLFVLQLMMQCKYSTLDIYGPKTDSAYWQQCEVMIHQMQGRVQYCGDILPAEVQKKIAEYHALIMLTKGENFGHALYESLSVGRPIITSNFTPWKNLQQYQAGLNVDIKNVGDCLSAIRFFSELNQVGFNDYCEGAHKMAVQYWDNIAVNGYKKLFA